MDKTLMRLTDTKKEKTQVNKITADVLKIQYFCEQLFINTFKNR